MMMGLKIMKRGIEGRNFSRRAREEGEKKAMSRGTLEEGEKGPA